ncbi:TonB-dependent receptor [Chitinophaga alhagiae]|uniref:TonB-dependent receptor n=1 Tax=Chitinophaga alhagiae TaxID=2203219 RepID=UPI000E5B3D5A|nr:TonB-dependent receptor [Chitinophaga alhagiae]
MQAKIFIPFLFLSLTCTSLFAQKSAVKGRIISTQGKPLSYITVSLERTAHGTQTDENGNYRIAGIPAGQYVLRVLSMEYAGQAKEIVIGNDTTITENFTLEVSAAKDLGEVVITAQKTGQQVKVQSINTAIYREQPTTLVELMNRSAGIRIRQTGGLGSRSNLMLNGFQNRSVRYFKDGIPLDYLGAGFDISLVPVNMLERVEVYKGILPFHLGADALGGALNMVTRHDVKSFLNASYELGSFNTHRASLNAYYKNAKGNLFAGINGFYNYSDNNYKATVRLTDPSTGASKDTTTRLFHNQFSNYYVEAFAGLANTGWADELRFTVTAFSVDKQFQFGSSMEKPYGAVTGSQRSVVPSLLYKKKLLNSKLDISQFLAYNTLRTATVDTAHGRYNWAGQYTRSETEIGEMSSTGSLSHINFRYLTSRTNLNYQLTNTQALNLNVVANNFRREGTDPYGHKFSTGKDVLTVPATYNKMIVALGLTSSFAKGRLQNSLIGKYFHYGTNASDADYRGDEVNTINSRSAWGIADGLRYNLNQYASLQLSVETSLRLPEQDELFGDGNLKLSNFELKPERSINIGAGYKVAIPASYRIEANAFYRYTKDLILLMPINFMFAQSQNVEKVKGLGVDVDGSVSVTRWLDANANVTFQELRLADPGNFARDKARLKNTPYFFANAGLSAKFNNLLRKQDKINIYWYYSFVREYYLDYIPKSVEPDGFLGLFGKAGIDARNIIPDQNIHTAGFTYSPAGMFSVGFQVKNIFDVAVFDNFKIQNPGRAFSVKISYSL